jgi:hypothetical protein
MSLDLFMPPDADDDPGFTRLPAGDLALAGARHVRVALAGGTLEIALPDPLGFLAMKVVAKRTLRPSATKDSFDIYPYAAMRGFSAVKSALARGGPVGEQIARDLADLFYDEESAGVVDVLAYASALDADERALLAAAVVDLFDGIARA